MPVLQLKRHEQIMRDIIGRTVVRSNLSDITDTSQWKWVISGVSRELDEVYYQLGRLRDVFDIKTAYGDDLDERAADIAPGTVSRISATKAIGTVQFSRTGTTGTVIIPAGTIVKTADGTTFSTTLQTQILNTQTTSEFVSIIAELPGSEGNVPSGTIVKFGAKIPGVDAVTNTAATIQGSPVESDDSLKNRLLAFIASLSRSTVEALEFLALGATDPTSGKIVKYSKCIEDIVEFGKVILYIDDGAGSASELGSAVTAEVVINSAVGGEEFLYLDQYPIDNINSTLTVNSDVRGTLTLGTDYYINPTNGQLKFVPALILNERITASYTPFTNLIPHVQKLVDGDANDRANYPGYRAAGTRVQVLSPTIVSISVEAVITVLEGADITTAISECQRLVVDYINTVGISGDIIRNEIIDIIMGVTGVSDVDVIAPASNIVVLDDQLPRASTATVLIS